MVVVVAVVVVVVVAAAYLKNMLLKIICGNIFPGGISKFQLTTF